MNYTAPKLTEKQSVALVNISRDGRPGASDPRVFNNLERMGLAVYDARIGRFYLTAKGAEAVGEPFDETPWDES